MLLLEYNATKGSRPKNGDIYLMHTTQGFIPVGVVSTEAFFGAAVMLHPYRALIHEVKDRSYYSLVESNELLMPPFLWPKTDFKKGGCFTKVSDKSHPIPQPFTYYYEYLPAGVWNPDERAFVPANPPYPRDRLPDFFPLEERRIERITHGTNPPEIVDVDNAPPEAQFITYCILSAVHLEFALEDSLFREGLLTGQRPLHPRYEDAEESSSMPAPQSVEELVRLTSLDGIDTMYFDTAALPTKIASIIIDAGNEPSGYFFDSLFRHVAERQKIDLSGIDFDSEAGLFSVSGDKLALEKLRVALLDLLGSPAELETLLSQVKLDNA